MYESLSSDTFNPQYPYSAKTLSVTPNDLHPPWLDLWQSQLLRPPSYGCSWHAQASGCQRCKINYQQKDQPDGRLASYQQYKCENDLCDCSLNQCLDDLCGRWPVWTITYVDYLRIGNIFRSNIYLCFVYLSRNEVIISRASLDGIESERSVRRNRACSSLMKTSAWSSLLVRVYWLDDEGSPLICHRYWSGLLARWQRSSFGMSLDRWRRADTSKSSLRQGCG